MPTTRFARRPADLPQGALVSRSLAPISRIGSGLRFGSWVRELDEAASNGTGDCRCVARSSNLGHRRQWRPLPAEHRDRLQAFLRQSAGRPSHCAQTPPGRGHASLRSVSCAGAGGVQLYRGCVAVFGVVPRTACLRPRVDAAVWRL
jgi:hypothetical protein